MHDLKGCYPQISFPLGIFGSVTECRHRENTSVFNYTSMPFAMFLLQSLVSCQTGGLTLSSLAWISDESFRSCTAILNQLVTADLTSIVKTGLEQCN